MTWNKSLICVILEKFAIQTIYLTLSWPFPARLYRVWFGACPGLPGSVPDGKCPEILPGSEYLGRLKDGDTESHEKPSKENRAVARSGAQVAQLPSLPPTLSKRVGGRARLQEVQSHRGMAERVAPLLPTGADQPRC